MSTTERQTALIVGGTSGIGFELALKLVGTHDVIVTGRHNPNRQDLEYLPLNLDGLQVNADIAKVCATLPKIDCFIYAAGYQQPQSIAGLTERDIDSMTSVGFTACAKIIARILREQDHLPGLILISSSAQWKPLERHILYRVTKHALGHLGECLSLDPAISKVLVFGPGGVNGTGFRKDHVPGYMDASVVADAILYAFNEDIPGAPFKYREVEMPHDTGIPRTHQCR